MRRVTSPMVGVLCLLLAAFAPSASAAPALVDDCFDAEATGSRPAGYVVEEAGGSVAVADVPSATNKSVFLNDPGSTNIRIVRKFPAQTGVVTAELAFMQPSLGSTTKVLRLLDEVGAAAAVHIETRKEGSGNVFSFKAADGAFVTLAPYDAKAWHVVRVVADPALQKADVWINGEKKLAGQPFSAPVTTIGALDSYTPGSSAKGHYVDNVRVFAGVAELTAAAPAPKAEAAPAAAASAVVKDLKVLDASRASLWSVEPSIQLGTAIFGDRAYTLESLPARLIGYELIRPSCDSKWHATDPLALFVAGADIEVYVAHDDRITVKPPWLAGWADSGEDAVDNEANPVTYSLLRRVFTAGSQVSLGNNGGSSGCTQYFVVVKGPGGPSTPPTTQAAPVSFPVVWDAVLTQRAEWYAGEEAIRIGDNVLAYQRDAGGWPKNLDMAEKLGDAERAALLSLKRNPADCTIDNSSTTTQIVFLAKLAGATGLDRFGEGCVKGIDYLLAAQYPNGGWPQYFPNTTGYYARITFNDNAMVNVLALLRDVSRGQGPYAFVDGGRRARAAEAVRTGIECILRSQVKVNGKLTAWCAQHDEKTLEPAAARSYELVSLSGSEGVGLVRFLMSIESPSPSVVQAVESAAAWFSAVRISGIKVVEKSDASLAGGIDKVVVADAAAPPIWARFYEIGTNRPFFCGRDGVKKYSMAEIEHERRVGYSWYTNAPAYLLDRELPAWRSRLR